VTRAALVGLGGGAGAVARFAVGRLLANPEFPWHTLGINAAGSFALGVLAVACRDRPGWYLLLGVGVCGGFTTFSTFSVEALDLLAKNRPGAAAGYVLGSVVAALAGAWVGMRAAG
jgi:CrcB protein